MKSLTVAGIVGGVVLGGIVGAAAVRLPADWLAAIDAMPGESRSEKLQAVIRLGLDVAQRRAKK